MGVGLARGIATIDLRVISRIVASWVITVPAGALLSAIFFLILHSLFL
jgi:PiT family inorganic phosphate transporter